MSITERIRRFWGNGSLPKERVWEWQKIYLLPSGKGVISKFSDRPLATYLVDEAKAKQIAGEIPHGTNAHYVDVVVQTMHRKPAAYSTL